jgi:uncharacterized membrane protein
MVLAFVGDSTITSLPRPALVRGLVVPAFFFAAGFLDVVVLFVFVIVGEVPVVEESSSRPSVVVDAAVAIVPSALMLCSFEPCLVGRGSPHERKWLPK